jgi:GntR family transcriptional repressor for pyruvate dehydrogenase complex
MNNIPVKPQKSSELVLQHIRMQIESGKYALGSKLPTVDDFADSYQVGRSTIREALSGLKAMGWVRIRHGGGSFVAEELPRGSEAEEASGIFYKTELLQEVLEVRKFIEAGCAALAAERRTDEDLRELEQKLQQMEASLGDEEASNQGDYQFHLSIARASHNTLFIAMMESMNDRLQASMKESRRLWFFSDRSTAEMLLQEHILIYEAIRKQDKQLAEERMKSHISKVEQVVQRLSRGE